jgi:hypothetical protein
MLIGDLSDPVHLTDEKMGAAGAIDRALHHRKPSNEVDQSKLIFIPKKELSGIIILFKLLTLNSEYYILYTVFIVQRQKV